VQFDVAERQEQLKAMLPDQLGTATGNYGFPVVVFGVAGWLVHHILTPWHMTKHPQG
jgi:hypothetical protein